MVRPGSAICLDDPPDWRARELEAAGARMPFAKAGHEAFEQGRHLEVEPAARFGEDANADVHPAAGHREHPAVTRKQAPIEPEDRLANVRVDPRGVGAPRDRDVSLVV